MSDTRATLTAALADRYAIERELGRGGMATVYLARDLRHDRPVALKVLHPELAASLGADRFLREIRLAARLQHPHILTVLDSGEVAVPGAHALLWFTMPFIRGESLRDRLRRERQLPVEDAFRIAREAADALGYAHAEGIVHRDVKPENILLTGSHALVADFGIARALGAGGDDKLTETGLTVGTPAYMSPEQASGQRELDARTDIYSLGVVLYEMLAGETPFSAPTTQAMIARRFMETPRPIRELRESVPEPVEQALQRALARTPADRFTGASELAAALAPPAFTTPAASATAASAVAPRPVSAGAAPAAESAPTESGPAASRPSHRYRSVVLLSIGFLLGLGVLFGWLRKRGGEAPAGGSEVKRLAVLPFDNLGAPDDEYFADGVTDEIRAKLASLPALQVTASRSAAEYKKSSKDLATIARELGVDYLLVGKVRWEKGDSGRSRVRVSPELVDARSGSTKWEQPFDANLTDVFQVQGDIAGKVAQALDVALGAGEKQALAERPTANVGAYDAFLKGEETSKGLSVGDPATLRRAIIYYDQAIATDSTFALAWAARGRSYAILYANSIPDPATGKLALESAQRAHALAPDRAEGYIALAEYYRSVANDPAQALEQAELGLKLAPRNVDLMVDAALAQQTQGHWDASAELLAKAQAIDPRSSQTAWRLTRTLLFLKRLDEALAACQRGLAIAPTHLGLLEHRAMIYTAKGDTASARAALRQAPAEVDQAALVAYVANFYDLFWLLDPNQRTLLFQLTPSQFDDDRGAWGLSIAGAYALQGDARRARAYADSARAAFEDQLRAAPGDAQIHALLGVALAYMGRSADAVREGKHATELMPLAKNAFSAPYVQQQLARIYMMAGQPDQALDQLEPLLKVPYYLTPAWLGVDPTFEPLRNNPRFQKLVARTS